MQEDFEVAQRQINNNHYCKVEANDYLPKYICESCTMKLRKAHQFIALCASTDKKLRETLEAIEELSSNDDPKEADVSHESNNQLKIKVEKNEPENSTITDVDCMFEAYVMEDDIIVEDQSSIDEKTEELDFDCIKKEKLEIPTESRLECDFENDELTSDTEVQLQSDKGHYQTSESSNVTEIFEDFIIEDAGESEGESNPKADAKKSLAESSKGKPVGRKIFACNSCTETFTNFNQLNAHKKSHGDKRFECAICLKRFSRNYRLRDHMLTHGEPQKLPCNLCDKTYTNRGNLERHIRHCHNKEKPHVCEICGWSFARRATLKLHTAVHSDAREFECDKCGKKFKAAYYLNVHKKSHIPVEQRKTKRPRQKRKIQICFCPYCGKRSTTHSLHNNHMRTHTGEKPFECPTCSKRFTFKQTLKTHMLVHTGEKPFSCETCGMTFRQKGHLQGHKLAVHTGLKQHKCVYCDKSFALRSNLTIHERLHTGEKPYQCSICNKRFNDTNGLKRHKVSHARHGQVEPTSRMQPPKESQDNIKADVTGDLNQLDVSLDQLNVYLDELGNEYTEIIESEATLEPVS